jgi:hypothetical protein
MLIITTETGGSLNAFYLYLSFFNFRHGRFLYYQLVSPPAVVKDFFPRNKGLLFQVPDKP